MALVSIPLTPYPDYRRVLTGNLSSLAIDADTEKVAFIVPLAKAGSLNKIAFRTAAVTSAQTLRASLQTVGGDGFPTGTLFGGSAAGTQASPAANTVYEVTLGTPATVASGDVDTLAAAVIEFDSTFGNLGISVSPLVTNTPYVAHYAGAPAWAKQNSVGPNVALGYDDGTYPPIGAALLSDSTGFNWSSSNSPDEYAAKLTVPFACRCVGAWGYVASGATGANFEVALYEGDASTTPLAAQTRAVDGDHVGAFSVAQPSFWFWKRTPKTLAAGTTVRVSFRATTTTACTGRYLVFPSGALMDSTPGGQNWSYSTRAGAAWTDTALRRWQMGLLLDQIDNGAGSGGRRAVVF